MKPSAFRSLPCTPRCHPVILPATCAEALSAKSSSQAGSLRAATPPAPSISLLKAGATVIIAAFVYFIPNANNDTALEIVQCVHTM